jgi:hypothetical protein
MKKLPACLIAILATAVVSVQSLCEEDPYPSHLVTSLPFWNESYLFPCMYAGAFPVKAAHDQHHLFYWLFKNISLPDTAPLVLWINGGPGSTSMFGLWLENGPLRVRVTNNQFNVHLNAAGSWNDIADVIYID